LTISLTIEEAAANRLKTSRLAWADMVTQQLQNSYTWRIEGIAAWHGQGWLLLG